MTGENALPPSPQLPPTGFWKKVWLILKVVQARLRFFFILAFIGVIALSWNTITTRWEKWMRPAKTVKSDTEYYCPMHLQIVRDKPGEKCPICGMPLSERKKGESSPEELPTGVLSRIQLTRFREQLAGVETAEVTYRPLTKEVRTVGFIEFDERQLRRISARVKGRIDKLYVNITDQMVEAGQDLALLYSPDLAIPVQNLLDARRPDEKDLVRRKLQLLGMDYDQIRQIEREGKPVTEVKIRSPIQGHVIRKYALEGDYVDEGARLYLVAGLATVWIEAQFYENELAFLRDGQKVRATTPAIPNRVFEGRVSFIHPHLDQSTRTLTVRFDIANPHHELRPGMYATVQALIPATVLKEEIYAVNPVAPIPALAMTAMQSLFSPSIPDPGLGFSSLLVAAGQTVLQQSQTVLAVPANAVIDTGSRKVVYRQASPGVYEGLEVQLGPRCGDYYPVESGLRAGERVATNGSFLIDAETRLNPAAGSTYFGASGGPRDTSAGHQSQISKKEEDRIRTGLAKLSASDRRLADAQRFCAIQTDNRLGSMGPPIKIMIENQPIFLCCAGCQKEAVDHPTQTLARAENMKAKVKSNKEKPGKEP
jgi:Cu(I)/Ag(I) efflux system membrane fusion protein